jgi:hypothetical protein
MFTLPFDTGALSTSQIALLLLGITKLNVRFLERKSTKHAGICRDATALHWPKGLIVISPSLIRTRVALATIDNEHHVWLHDGGGSRSTNLWASGNIKGKPGMR